MHIFDEAQRHLEIACAKYGVRLPPKEGPKPPEVLAHYQQYTSTGKIVNVGSEAQIGSYEWGQAHPSVSERWFEIAKKKKAWDADMAALLRRRSEWDLPPETEAAPTPEPEA